MRVRFVPRFRSRSRGDRRRSTILLGTVAALSLGANVALAGPEPARSPRAAGTPTLRDLITEASQRFGVPMSWIVEVMCVESRGRVDALSPKGAIGLMQVMPQTYADMRARYGLGANPRNPRDNILAGTAYLRLLYDRYGAPGFLVAYNAGPGRWEDYQERARPLPAETVAYIARLGPVVGWSVLASPPFAGSDAPRSPFAAPIFVQLASASTGGQTSPERERIVRVIDANTSIIGRADAIFVVRRRAADAQPENRPEDGTIAGPASPENRAAVSPSRLAPASNPLFPDRTSAGTSR